MKEVIEDFEKQNSVLLSNGQKQLLEDFWSFRLKWGYKYCRICGKPLVDSEFRTLSIYDFQITCNAHRHLRNVLNTDAYFRAYGTFELTPQRKVEVLLEAEHSNYFDAYREKAIRLLKKAYGNEWIFANDNDTFFSRIVRFLNDLFK